MAKQLVLVVRQTFSFQGAHINPGDVVTDAAEIAAIRAAHPEKVIPTMHDVPDAPAPEDGAPATAEPAHQDVAPTHA